jgi:hypothetical protein
MNGYPEWLVDKIAKASFNAINVHKWDSPDTADWERDIHRDVAWAILDRIGFHTNPNGPIYWVSEIQWEGM